MANQNIEDAIFSSPTADIGCDREAWPAHVQQSFLLVEAEALADDHEVSVAIDAALVDELSATPDERIVPEIDVASPASARMSYLALEDEWVAETCDLAGGRATLFSTPAAVETVGVYVLEDGTVGTWRPV